MRDPLSIEPLPQEDVPPPVGWEDREFLGGERDVRHSRQIMVGKSKGEIYLDFGECARQIVFTPAQAYNLALVLLRKSGH